ncbi:MAG: replication factor C large subunit [archaeon GW2011_AR17]|nr:MAG: replication factor C large subunit [archaeon GW2011_AR17]MBS3154259.1 replication factor C large subunit [Candidatus Woesearchaeota archaeon]HIH14861.1 replication factor C large subunit [Nanoarchaeota archaeon]HIH58880.1 replication factor C large subunit [Nanoarchaeota archaeon]HII14030.1 replication factor C large subunit [Nanoarchaeota archaeon]
MIPWTKKYEPKKSTDILGQELALYKIKEALKLKRTILIYGPTGTGKTSAVQVIGKELGLELFEISASDARNKENIENTIGNSLAQQSLFAKGKVILIDDIDALSGTKDRGGLPTILALIEKTKHAIAITCIDPWDDKYSKLRKQCLLIEFQALKKENMFNYLKNIADAESIQYQEKDLLDIIKLSKGDMRAAITDIQTYSITKTINTEEKSERDREESMQYCLRKILKSKKWEETINVFDKVDEDLNECLLWLDENLPKEYNAEDLKKAYAYLSKADVYNGRIRRWQHWRFLIYINMLITSGVATAKKETNINATEYTRTMRILKLWQANMKYAKKKSIANKIAEHTHTSTKRAIRDSLPYLKNILLQPETIKELQLDEEEISWLQK